MGMLQKSNQRKFGGTGTELQQISTWAMLIMLTYWEKDQILTQKLVWMSVYK
jgi:hypothetical protein